VLCTLVEEKEQTIEERAVFEGGKMSDKGDEEALEAFNPEEEEEELNAEKDEDGDHAPADEEEEVEEDGEEEGYASVAPADGGEEENKSLATSSHAGAGREIVFVAKEEIDEDDDQLAAKLCVACLGSFSYFPRKSYVMVEELGDQPRRQLVPVTRVTLIKSRKVVVILSWTGLSKQLRAKSLVKAGVLIAKSGNYDMAQELFESVRARGGANDGFLECNLAQCYAREFRFREAKSLMREALLKIKDEHARFEMHLVFGHIYDASDDLEGAERHYKKAVDCRIRDIDLKDAQVAIALTLLADIRIKRGKLAQAQEACQEALDIYEMLKESKNDPGMERAADKLARVYEMMESPHEMTPEERENHHIAMARTIMSMAKTYESAESADAEASKGLKILEDHLGQDHSKVDEYKKNMLELQLSFRGEE